MLELKIKAGRRSIPIFDLPATLGRQAAYQEIGDQIDALIAFMDDLGGDPDLEEDDDAGGNIIDEKHDALSWPEWHTLPPQHRGSGNYTGKLLEHVDRGIAHDDDEEDDAPEEDDPIGQCDEDGVNTSSDLIRYTTGSRGAGCPISDPGGGDVIDMELDEDAEALRPLYAIDQTAGPINVLAANHRHEILQQIRMHSGGDSRWLKQLHARLAALDERQAAMVKAASSNDN